MPDEAAAVPAFQQAVAAVLHAVGLRPELVFIDNRSTDATGAVLASLAAAVPCVRVLTLSRNFGKEAALTARLDDARGDVPKETCQCRWTWTCRTRQA